MFRTWRLWARTLKRPFWRSPGGALTRRKVLRETFRADPKGEGRRAGSGGRLADADRPNKERAAAALARPGVHHLQRDTANDLLRLLRPAGGGREDRGHGGGRLPARLFRGLRGNKRDALLLRRWG